jgi:hypothetical protein
LTAIVVVALVVFFTYVGRYSPDPQETIVLGQSSIFADSTAAFRILVRDHDGSAPIAGARVRLAIEGQGRREELGTFVTDEGGSLSDVVHVPALAPGSYQLTVESSSNVGEDHIVKSIRVKQACQTCVTTDKPVYQPGQTIHMRTLTLEEVSLKPVADQPVTFEVTDAKGNKIYKASRTTCRYGIASCDLPLADEVNLGDYHIRVTAGTVESDRVVQVQRYALPKFKVALTTDKPFYLRSEQVRGEVHADYFFGKPVVNAQVTATGKTLGSRPEEVFRVAGITDSNGVFIFDSSFNERFVNERTDDSEQSRPSRRGEMVQPDIPFQIEVLTKDGTGHAETAVEQRTLARQAINIHVFPDDDNFIGGVDNIFYILTAYPTGQPAVCALEVNGTPLSSDSMGVTVFKVRLTAPALVLDIKARDAAGLTGSWTNEIVGTRGNDLQLGTDRAVYRTGEKLVATILSPGHRTAFFLDVLRNGRTVLTRTLMPNDEGQAQLIMDLSSDLWGTLVLKAYTVHRGDRIDMTTRVVHVRQADDLRIEASLDEAVYRPGETAKAQLHVTDRSGSPVPAALSLTAVDEAVFYICENHPGMLDQFFLTDGKLPLAGYEMAFAVSPAKLLSGDEQYQDLARAVFSASGQVAGWRRGYQNRRDDMDAQTYAIYGTPDQQDYSLQAESRSQKLYQAAVFRYRYFHVPLMTLAVLIGLMVPLSLLVIFSRSLFRLFRQTAAEVNEQTQRLTPDAVDRRVYVLAFTVLLPMVAYLTAMVFVGLHEPRRSYLWRQESGIDPALLGVIVVVTSALATVGFPLVYRFGSVPFRQLGKAAAKVLTLPVLCIGLACWITYVAARLILRMSSSLDHDVLGLLSLAGSFAACLGLCWRAGVATRKPPGRFYTDLGRSGRTVLVILLSLILVVPVWLVLSSEILTRWIPSRPSRTYSRELIVNSGTRSMAFYDDDYDDVMMGGMGGAGYGGMGGMAGYAGYAMRGPIAGRSPELLRVRRYFPETLLWQPQLITDEAGQASVEIPLADSITVWKMNVDAVSATGRLGNSVMDVRVFQDFFVDLDLPVALTRGDEISIPVLCHSYLPKPQAVTVTLEPAPWCEVLGPTVQKADLGPNDVKSVAFRIKAKEVGTHKLAVLAQGESLSDAVRQSVEVRCDGVEVEDLQGGVLSRSAEHTFDLPAESIPNSQRLWLRLYPSMFSEVIEGLDSIFQMPHGCFEQTSSTTYPNIMALLYMRQTGRITPEVEAKARAYIGVGYQKLLTFEVRDGGFDWFGRPPAKEKLTAYGIMELTDMAQVHDVDRSVIDRASQWLLSRQNPNGSWEDSDQWQGEPGRESRVPAAAYIAWALAQARIQDRRLDRVFKFLRENVRETDSAYTLALTANAFLTVDANDAFGRKLLTRLQSSFRTDGRLGWISSSGTGGLYSRGLGLDIETTALSVLAMMKVNAFAEMIPKALAWLCEQKDQRGTWYSTQATVLAMRALIAGTHITQKTDAPARISVTINDSDASSIEVIPETRDLLHSLDLTSHLKPGANTVHLTQEGAMELPYRLVGTHWVPRPTLTAPASAELAMDVRYDKDHLRVNDLLRCSVQVTPASLAPLNMVVVELALPPGFALNPSTFDRLVDSGVFARYEVASDRVVLYIRNTVPKKGVRFSYELKALHPLRVRVPPSCVYEYYQPKNRTETLPCEILVE